MVAALAIGVDHQRDVRGTVRIVFDTLDLGRDAVLVVAHEIDHAVVVTVTAALVAHGDVTIVVAAGLLELGFQQGGVTGTLVQVVTGDLHGMATASGSRFDLDNSHD